jgi:hemoglobin-like flavoprotein
MTHRQIELVQASFQQLGPRAEQAGQLFCDRLFEMDPSMKKLLRGCGREQARDLIQMLGVVVAGLRRFDQFPRAVEELMQPYAGYGLRDEHCTKAAAASLCAWQEALGESFTHEVCEAWIAMYEKISTAILWSNLRGHDMLGPDTPVSNIWEADNQPRAMAMSSTA